MRINDELLDKLGAYFEYHNILERMCITFEQFVAIHQQGRWQEFNR